MRKQLYTTEQLIEALLQNKDTTRVYVICNAYLMNNEKNRCNSKTKWYITTAYDMLDTSFNINETEKKEFLRLHFEYMSKLMEKYKTFEELPIHKLLDRFELLKDININ